MEARFVFLSYARKDLIFARSLHEQLEAMQVQVRWDQEQSPGCDWTEQLFAWLKGADAVLVVVSQHSVISLSVKNEVLLALDCGHLVIPVLLQDAEGGLLLLIRSLQWIDARNGRDPLLDLLQVLRADRNGPAHELPPLRNDNPAIDRQLAPPPPTTTRAQVTLVLSGDVRDFNWREQHSLREILARFANISPHDISIVQIEAGSVRVTLELPEVTGRWLIELHQRGDPLMALLDVRDVHSLRVLRPEMPGLIARLHSWLLPGGTPLVPGWMGVGALVAVLLVGLIAFFSPVLPPGTPIGVVAQAQGEIVVQHAGWIAYVPLLPGSTLFAGDRLRLGASALARVVCADGTLVLVQPGTQRAPCRANTNTIIFGGAQQQVRGSITPYIARLIEPRATHLLTTTPTIRWTAVANASTYSIVLRRGADMLWEINVSNTTAVTYPASVPPLQPGQTYRFVITAAGGSAEQAQGIGFTVLTAEAARQVKAQEQQIRQLGLDESTTHFVLSHLYARNELYAEALSLLEPITTTVNQPAYFQLQGDLYSTIGLPDLAIAYYQQAVSTARQMDDRQGQALALRKLGEVYSLSGDRERAKMHYQQALEFYQEVGDADAVEDLLRRLEDLV